MKYLKVFHDILPALEQLDDADAGQYFKTLLTYSATGEVIPLSGVALGMFMMEKTRIDREQLYEENFVEKQRENGKKGGRPKKPKETQENPKNPSLFPKTQKSLTVTITNNSNYNSNCNNELISVDEAQARQAEIDSVLDAADRAGFAHSQLVMDSLTMLMSEHPTDWVLKAINAAGEAGKTSIPYVRAILDRYKRQGNTEPSKKPSNVKPLPAQAYSQREYKDETKAPDWMIQAMKE